MNESWTKAEKVIARRVFDAAYPHPAVQPAAGKKQFLVNLSAIIQ